MKTYKILFIFILISVNIIKKSHGQNTFFDSYGWSLGTGLLINTADSCYMGFANDNISSQHINLYKLNPLGKLLWVKDLPFAAILPAIQMISLSDSSVAFIGQQVLPYVLVVIKADLNGNLIWTKTLTIPNSFNFTSLAPTTDGGLILTGGGCAGSDMIIHLGPDGRIRSQHSHYSSSVQYPFQNVLSIIHDGNNEYSSLGYAGSTVPQIYSPLIFFRTDSAGNVSNYSEIHFPYGPASSWSLGNRYLAKSSSGGHFCTFGVSDTIQKNHFVLFYLNAHDQLIWFKNIETTDTVISPTNILPTTDGGCIITGSNIISLNSSPKYLPFAMKFDSNGNVIWSKMAGDPSSSYWNQIMIRGIAPANDSGWLTSIDRKGSTNICKVDSLFNGFCNYTPFTPIVTDYIPKIDSFIITKNLIVFNEDSIFPISTQLAFNLTTECSTTGIENNGKSFPLGITPNPAFSFVSLNSADLSNKKATVAIYDVLGKENLLHNYSAGTDGEIVIDISTFKNGIYFIRLIQNGKEFQGKFVKE